MNLLLLAFILELEFSNIDIAAVQRLGLSQSVAVQTTRYVGGGGMVTSHPFGHHLLLISYGTSVVHLIWIGRNYYSMSQLHFPSLNVVSNIYLI